MGKMQPDRIERISDRGECAVSAGPMELISRRTCNRKHGAGRRWPQVHPIMENIPGKETYGIMVFCYRNRFMQIFKKKF